MTAQFSPANQLNYEIQQYSANIHQGTPHSFTRWYSDGGAMWAESSSGSMLLFVDFVHETVRVPEWKHDRDGTPLLQPMPENWSAMYLGSLFDRYTGDALFPEEFKMTTTLKGWEGNL